MLAQTRSMEKILVNNKKTSFRIQAIDYQNNFKPYKVIKNINISDGHHGCTSSHIKALNTYLETCNDEYCFIVEDDVSNIYSNYWKKTHYDLLKYGTFEILQLQTTEDYFNNIDMNPIMLDKFCSGASIYRIQRNIASEIVKKYLHENTINLSIHNYPVADGLIWSHGTVYLIPMFSYIDVKDSDTTPDNDKMDNIWETYFLNSKNKYNDMWKRIK